MRPRHYTAENNTALPALSIASGASMRPRHYTAENELLGAIEAADIPASMRPRHYTAENAVTHQLDDRPSLGFNEAAALHRGKHDDASYRAALAAIALQ